jgi:hypothetical protein
MIEDPPAPPVHPATNSAVAGPFFGSLVPRLLTVLLVAASAVGLLSVPISVYDDSLLLVGARLVASGKTPYVDFYTHYGPLGYSILASLIRLIRDPGLALRLGEILLLGGIAILFHLLFRSFQPKNTPREFPVPFFVGALSAVAIEPAFFGFAFATAALVFFLLARNAPEGRLATLLSAAAGVALAVVVLIRPVFGAYCAGAIFLTEIACLPRSGGSRRLVMGPAVFFGAAAGAALALWLSLFPGIPWFLAFDATILRPARLMGAAGERYLEPGFLTAAETGVLGIARAIATGAALVATTIAWTLAVSRGRTRRFAGGCVAAGGLLPLVLTVSDHPARDAGSLSLAFFVLACSIVYSARSALRESPLLQASAMFGLAAAASGHYFWARADGAHVLPLLTLGVAGGALLLASLHARGRAAIVSLLLFTWVSAAPGVHFPAAVLLNWNVVAKLRPWRCTLGPADAKMAVVYADSLADPRSRFVAVGSSQAWASADPILLFLMSSRPPYTRWFQYDPGVQTSGTVQEEMARELEASGSRSAVVWRAEMYLSDRVPPDTTTRSRFDELFDRLYPIRASADDDSPPSV